MKTGLTPSTKPLPKEERYRRLGEELARTFIERPRLGFFETLFSLNRRKALKANK